MILRFQNCFMKRKLSLLIILTSSFSLICSAQVQPGFKIGASVPDIKGNTEQSKGYTSRLAPFFGISLAKKISPYFKIQTEINYSPQGGKRNGMQPIDPSQFGVSVPNGTILYANFKNETKLNYIEVPVMLQFNIDKSKDDNHVFYFAGIGPYVAFRLNSKTITSGKSLIYVDPQGSLPLTIDDIPLPAQSFDSRTNLKDEIKKVSAGIVGGIGSGYNFQEHQFFLEARFTRGLTNIQTHPETGGKNKTGSLIFAAGYMYSF